MRQGLELADDVGVAPEREVGVDPLLQRGQAELLQAGALVAREGLRELRERWAAPQCERLPKELGGVLRPT